jgi:hypothetical protein
VDVLVHYARDEAEAQTVVKQIHDGGGRAAVAPAPSDGPSSTS